MDTTAAFVHVLLFECRHCESPIPAAATSDNRSLEVIDGGSFPLRCSCGWSANLNGTDAKRHWVELWRADDGSHRRQEGSKLREN